MNKWIGLTLDQEIEQWNKEQEYHTSEDMFSCPECGEQYAYEDEAEECCRINEHLNDEE